MMPKNIASKWLVSNFSLKITKLELTPFLVELPIKITEHISENVEEVLSLLGKPLLHYR